MKQIFTLLMVTGLFYLSSCGNGGNDKLPTVPIPDSTSKGSTLNFSYSGINGPESFSILDYTINNSPYYSIYASIIFNATDSLFHLKIQLIDHKLSKMALNIALTSPNHTGDYFVTDNSSIFTDYSQGDNTAYEITSGSTVNISQATYPIQGTLNIGLYHNFVNYSATGSFNVYPQ